MPIKLVEAEVRLRGSPLFRRPLRSSPGALGGGREYTFWVVAFRSLGIRQRCDSSGRRVRALPVGGGKEKCRHAGFKTDVLDANDEENSTQLRAEFTEWSQINHRIIARSIAGSRVTLLCAPCLVVAAASACLQNALAALDLLTRLRSLRGWGTRAFCGRAWLRLESLVVQLSRRRALRRLMILPCSPPFLFRGVEAMLRHCRFFLYQHGDDRASPPAGKRAGRILGASRMGYLSRLKWFQSSYWGLCFSALGGRALRVGISLAIPQGAKFCVWESPATSQWNSLGLSSM